jgi:hypothetical protein
MTWCTAALALALAATTPPPTTAPKGSEATRPEGQRRISLNYRGPLREAVKRIADDGKLNVVVRGGLDEEGEFHFENVPAQEALTTLAAAYNLTLEQHASVFTLRPMSGPEQALRVQAALERLRHEGSAPHAVAVVPPLPSLPPIPPVPAIAPRAPAADEDADSDSDAASDTADERSAAEDRRSQAEDRRAQALDRKQEMRDRLREMKERLRGLPHHSSKSCDVSATGNYVVEEGQEVCDVVVYGGNLEVLGQVSGDAVAFGGNVHVGSDAEVQGDVVAFGGEVSKDEDAEIHGQQLSFGGSSGAGMVTKGAKAWKNATTPGNHSDSSHGLSPKLPNLLLQFAVFFGLSFLFLMFAPARMKQIEGELKRDPVKCGVAGLLGSVALVPMSILLAVTIIGIPFVFVLWLVVGLGVAMGFSAVAAEIGTRLPILKPNRKTQAAVLALGIGVLLLVELIPVLGPLVLAVVGFLALGSIIRTRFGGRAQGFPEPI